MPKKTKKLKEFGDSTDFAQNNTVEGAPVAYAEEGHNSRPGFNPALEQSFLRVEKMKADINEINKAIRAEINEAKSSFNVSSHAYRYELAQRKLDPEVRKQREHEIEDLHFMLGYDLANDVQDERDEDDTDIENDPVEAGKKEAKKLKAV